MTKTEKTIVVAVVAGVLASMISKWLERFGKGYSPYGGQGGGGLNEAVFKTHVDMLTLPSISYGVPDGLNPSVFNVSEDWISADDWARIYSDGWGLPGAGPSSEWGNVVIRG